MSSMSYDIVDSELSLRSVMAAVQQQADRCKAAAGRKVFLRRNRRRIGKQNTGHSYLRCRLAATKWSSHRISRLAAENFT